MRQKKLNQIENNRIKNVEDNKNLSRRRFVISGGLAATALALSQGQTRAAGSNGNAGELPEPVEGAYNIRDFGAKGDGTTLDSPAINKTIESCSFY